VGALLGFQSHMDVRASRTKIRLNTRDFTKNGGTSFSEYPDLRIIVVNDGSSDATAETMLSEFNMTETYLVRDTETISHKPIRNIYRSNIYPSLLFIDKENGKKADAINVGLIKKMEKKRMLLMLA